MCAEVDGSEAEAAVRALTSHPGVRGAALCWLVDCGYEPPEVVFIPGEPGPFVDVLAHRLVKGPKAMAATPGLASNHEDQIAVLKPLWRSPSPATEAVLVAPGETHRTRRLPKPPAARRSAAGAAAPAEPPSGAHGAVESPPEPDDVGLRPLSEWPAPG